MTPSARLCRACGRPIDGRPTDRPAKREEPRVYCSKRCRSRRISPADRRLERTLIELLERLAPNASLCPSEVARKAAGETWRSQMEAVRRAGRRLAAQGLVEFTQRGRRVDPPTARGPVRIRLCRR
jgi:hypothetical protein